MSKASTVKTSSDARDDAPLRKADIASGKLVLRKRGAVGAVLPNKQRVNIFLDGAVVEHFKTKAGARGYQTLINEALKQAIHAEGIQAVVRKTIREELRRTQRPALIPSAGQVSGFRSQHHRPSCIRRTPCKSAICAP